MSTHSPGPDPTSGSSTESTLGQVTDGARRLGLRRILFLLLAVYGVLLALFNLKSVEINFVLFSAQASLFVVIALATGIGFLGGYLFDGLRARRRKS